MKTSLKLLAVAAVLLFSASSSQAQLIVNDYTAKVITFDATLSGVWSIGGGTPSGSQAGPTPSGSIPYDSDAWAMRAGATQNLTLPAALAGSGTELGFGGTSAAGAISRGVNNVANFGTSGIGVVIGAGFGNAIGMRPSGGSGTDFGTVFLRVQNTTGASVSSWKIDYNPYYIDIGVATGGAFAFSTDGGSSFSSNVGALGFTTPGLNAVASPAIGDWTAISLSETTISASVSNNSYLILRFALGTDAGSNSTVNRIAIDNISVTAIPEPTTWALLAGSLTVLVTFRRRRRG